MKYRVRRYREPTKYVDLELLEGECAACECAHAECDMSSGDVVFLEIGQVLYRVECVMDNQSYLCGVVQPSEADAEIAGSR